MFFILSCTDEPTLNNYNVAIKNSSLQTINILAYSSDNLISNITLNDNETGLNCSYTDEGFKGYKLIECEIDSIVFRFDNGKGYISDINTPSSFDFLNNNNLFGNSIKFIETNNTYEFLITQEDYENAYDLP